MSRTWAALLLGLSLAAAGCRTPGSIVPLPDPAGRIELLQLLHRAARDADGAMRVPAVERLVDGAVTRMSGTELPLDAWDSFIDEPSVIQVIAVPEAGVLARVVVERLKLVAPTGVPVELVEGRDALSGASGSALVVLVTKPAWHDGAIDPALEALVGPAGGPRPALAFADLLGPVVDGQGWAADTAIAARDPRAVALAARYVLEARSSRRIPGLAPLAAWAGVAPGRLDWQRIAVTD